MVQYGPIIFPASLKLGFVYLVHGFGFCAVFDQGQLHSESLCIIVSADCHAISVVALVLLMASCC